jgi:hypothetical protein
MAKEGLVQEMDCPIDQGLLFPNIDVEDKVYLYCISCNYKSYIGTDLYSDMKRTVDGKHNV